MVLLFCIFGIVCYFKGALKAIETPAVEKTTTRAAASTDKTIS